MNETRTNNPAESFARIVNMLMGVWGNSIRSVPVYMPLFYVVDMRLRALLNRFRAIADQIQAGTFRSAPPRPRKPRAPDAPPPKKRPVQWCLALCLASLSATEVPRLPTKKGWMLTLLGRNAGAAALVGRHLYSLLEDPEMQALIAAAPKEMGRILRALAKMLGVDSKLIPQLARKKRGPRARATRAKAPRAKAPRAEGFASEGATLEGAGPEPSASQARRVEKRPYAPGAAFRIPRWRLARERENAAALKELADAKAAAEAAALASPKPKVMRRGWVSIPGLIGR